MIVLALDMVPPIGVGTLVRAQPSGRLGRVIAQHQRFPQLCGRYYRVAHGAWSTYYWEHEIVMAVAESFQHVLTAMRSPLQAYKAEWRMKPEESLTQFRSRDWDTLEHRQVGGAGALAAAYMNAAKVEDLLRRIGTRVAGSSVTISDALNHGSALALGAAQMVNSSLLTHLRATPWYEHATLLMLRTALEMAGASALFAIGPADQQRAWIEGHHVSPTNITLPVLRDLLHDARADGSRSRECLRMALGARPFHESVHRRRRSSSRGGVRGASVCGVVCGGRRRSTRRHRRSGRLAGGVARAASVGDRTFHECALSRSRRSCAPSPRRMTLPQEAHDGGGTAEVPQLRP